MAEPSFLSPNFIIPAGTQVVLKKDHDVMGPAPDAATERPFKKAGSVGTVTVPPLTNDYTYVIEFADGTVVRARKQDLSVRRLDAPEDELPQREIAAYEPHVFYRVRMGSVAFGLSTQGSDSDERGIYAPPAAWHWSLQPLPEQIEFKRMADGRILDHNSAEHALEDICWWEIAKFLKLALKANPNALEALFVDEKHILGCDALGRKLRAIRGAFLSKYLYRTYSGYVLSQFKKMKRDIAGGGTHRPKHAMHLIRLLYSGIEALKGNGIMVDVGPFRDELLRIRNEARPFDEIYDRALELERRFQDEFARTQLPETPDVAAVDAFLIEVRRSRV